MTVLTPQTNLRVAAYVLAADPAWLSAGVRSYYGLVSRIFVSYDADGRSWTGQQLPIERCLDIIRELDTDGKVTLLPGRFWRPAERPLDNDTYQRQVCIDAASEIADWIIQLDADEILLDPATFARELVAADADGRDGLEYPARCLYASLARGRYLEESRRFGGIAATYPGPVAVRAGSRLRVARQGPSSLRRVDFRKRNTDPSHPRSSPVDAVIAPAQGMIHFSWVRSEEELRAKGRSSGHAHDFDWDKAIDSWLWHQRHPYLTALTTPLRRRPPSRWLRISRIELPDGLSGLDDR
jgi:hypothetical protein